MAKALAAWDSLDSPSAYIRTYSAGKDANYTFLKAYFASRETDFTFELLQFGMNCCEFPLDYK